MIEKKIAIEKIPKCKRCNRPDDPTRFVYFFKSKVHPADLKYPDFSPDRYEEYPEYKPFYLIKCSINRCEVIFQL